jgi:hypothetical protein
MRILPHSGNRFVITIPRFPMLSRYSNSWSCLGRSLCVHGVFRVSGLPAPAVLPGCRWLPPMTKPWYRSKMAELFSTGAKVRLACIHGGTRCCRVFRQRWINSRECLRPRNWNSQPSINGRWCMSITCLRARTGVVRPISPRCCPGWLWSRRA